jgi:hypothetical protein
MPAPVAGIHVFLFLSSVSKTWMAGTGPAMTMLQVIATGFIGVRVVDFQIPLQLENGL